MHPSARPYADRRIALLTQHGKERVIAPALEPGLGCTIEHVSGFDTDLLGTFTREQAQAYLRSNLFTQDVVEALKPYLNGAPDVRIYDVA